MFFTKYNFYLLSYDFPLLIHVIVSTAFVIELKNISNYSLVHYTCTCTVCTSLPGLSHFKENCWAHVILKNISSCQENLHSYP